MGLELSKVDAWYRWKPFFLSAISILFISNPLIGQNSESNTNLRYHQILLTTDTLISEKNTILPSTVEITTTLSDSVITEITHNSISFSNSSSQSQSIGLKYRVMPVDLYSSQAIIDSTDVDKELRLQVAGVDYYDKNYNARRIIQSNKLQYSGSFSRGVSFGNAQDVVLNSNFNMQMIGDLGNGLRVKAAISDENIPIQPQGNTQVLQEFDKIFIEVEKDNTALIAGDYELSRPNSYFMNYYKKLKGVSVRTDQNLGNGWKTYNRASFAISRGKFRRQNLETQEGNQGPYRLTGSDNEIFLQVLSGTEKVYADGQLLIRGETNDYVIDYNRAEIKFTANRIITDNLRIIIEFEYAVQSYLRSLYATETSIENDKWAFNINIYNEQDSKSLANNLELDTTDLRTLTEGGNNELFRSGIFPITEETSEDVIRYNNINQPYLLYSPEDSINSVGAVFSNLGSNQGSYIIDTQAGANGRVYSYVGEGEGNYEPFIKLIAPEKKQLFTFSANHQISDSTDIYLEGSISNNDKNRFSALGNNLNLGQAIFGRIADHRSLNNKWKITTTSQIERSDKNFIALNPYRAPEFTRDWNLSSTIRQDAQLLHSTSVKVGTEHLSFRYALSGFNEQVFYDGLRHIGEINYRKDSWYVNVKGDWLESETVSDKSFFSRPRATIRKSFLNQKLTLGSYFEKERNIRRDIASNDLFSNSFNYELYRIYAESAISSDLNITLGFSRRTDYNFLIDQLSTASIADNYELSGRWKEGSASQLKWNLTYRDFKVTDDFINQKNPNRSFIGNLDHRLKLWKEGLTLNTFYESTSGQEPNIEFQYIRVQDGEGAYQWIDYNQDSIQQVTEFELSNYSDEGQYMRITIFNNEFVSTNRSIINQSLKVEPRKIWNIQKGFLSKVILTSRYRLDEKSLNSSDNGIVKFVNFDLRDTSLVAFNSSIDHNLFYNRGNPNYDIQLSYRSLNNKIRQISGTELRLSDQYYSRIRINLKKKLDAILEGAVGQKERTSENFSNQNFLINFWNLSPQLNFRLSNKLRLVFRYKYEINQNSLGIEQSIINDGGLDLTWRQDSNSNLLLNLSYVNINFDGDRNTTIEFEMLQGLRNGQNIVWRCNYTRRISSNIDLIFNYNGRKSEGSRLIHNLGMQMRALF